MATPKEQHDARELARQASLGPDGERDTAAELPRRMAAPVGAEDQADGQPENELELHDHSTGDREAGRTADARRSGRRAR